MWPSLLYEMLPFVEGSPAQNEQNELNIQMSHLSPSAEHAQVNIYTNTHTPTIYKYSQRVHVVASEY